MWATTTLMDLVGPYAQTTDCPLEKWFRDAKIYQLFEGTAQVQRLVISRMQAREYRERLAEAAEIAKGTAAANGAASGNGRRPREAGKPATAVDIALQPPFQSRPRSGVQPVGAG